VHVKLVYAAWQLLWLAWLPLLPLPTVMLQVPECVQLYELDWLLPTVMLHELVLAASQVPS
jgi:hypothetical protein